MPQNEGRNVLLYTQHLFHSFKELLHPSHDQSSSQYVPPCLAVGDMMVQETGPLAGFSTVLDAGEHAYISLWNATIS